MGGLPQGPGAGASGLAALAAPWGSSAPPRPPPRRFPSGLPPRPVGRAVSILQGHPWLSDAPGRALGGFSLQRSGSRLCHWDASRTKPEEGERARRDWAKVTEGVRDKSKVCPCGTQPAASLNPSLLWASPKLPEGVVLLTNV